MLARGFVLFVLALLLAPLASAQAPSKSKIRADVRSEVSSGATNIQIPGNGTRALNRGVWEHRRSITYEVPFAEMEGVTVEYYGDVVYQGGRFHSFRPSTQRYLGIPDPSPEEVDAVLQTQFDETFPLGALNEGYSYELLTDRTPEWKNPNVVTVYLRTRSKHRRDARTLREVEAIRRVEMVRDEIGGPWTKFYAGTDSEEEVGREERMEAELDRLQRLYDLSRIRRAEAEAASVPEIEFKPFENNVYLAIVTYKMLREADPATLEAYLRKVMADGFFEQGSRTALNANGRALIDLALEVAHGREDTYAEHHCEAIAFDLDRTESAQNRSYIRSIVDTPPRGQGNSWSTEMVIQSFASGYENGEPVYEPFKLYGLSITLHNEGDNLAWLRSFDDRSRVCPDDAKWRNTPLGRLTPSNH